MSTATQQQVADPDEERLKEARDRIRNEFGAAVALKASRAFVAQHAMARNIAFETVSPAVRVPTVLELSPDPENEVLVEFPPAVAQTAHDAARRVLELFGEEGAEHSARTLLRRHRIEKRRNSFFLTARPVIDSLSRASGGPLGALSEHVTLQTVQPQLVDSCWLNRSVRTAADPRTVAAVADDPSVTTIDVPRRLSKEISATAALVNAPAFRLTNNASG